jgi:hypothetical protein
MRSVMFMKFLEFAWQGFTELGTMKAKVSKYSACRLELQKALLQQSSTKTPEKTPTDVAAALMSCVMSLSMPSDDDDVLPKWMKDFMLSPEGAQLIAFLEENPPSQPPSTHLAVSRCFASVWSYFKDSFLVPHGHGSRSVDIAVGDELLQMIFHRLPFKNSWIEFGVACSEIVQKESEFPEGMLPASSH